MDRMTERSVSNLFDSEATWPFVLRVDEVDECVNYLQNKINTPKLLRIFGTSGSGKSFFSKEIILKLVEQGSVKAALYIDVPAADLEASSFFDKIHNQLFESRHVDRTSPCFLSKSIASKWRAQNKKNHSSKMSYVYRVVRDLTNQIPVVGPFIKAIMPVSLTIEPSSKQEHISAFRFFLKQSQSQPILLIIDNIQFLPVALREILEAEFIGIGYYLNLVIVERTLGHVKFEWMPLKQEVDTKDLTLGAASLEEIVKLVKIVFPTDLDVSTLANSIFRRSEGNLKSSWFQLKFIVERRIRQTPEKDIDSYEGVIQSLQPVDQAVLRLVVFLLGGLSIIHVIELFQASDFKLGTETVTGSITDLVSLGLLVVNSEHRDRVRVEHEIVAHVVTDLTPEDDKLELREQLVKAISYVLEFGTKNDSDDDDALYDRLIGIAHEKEVRASAIFQSHIVTFIHMQNTQEKYSYLANICRDSVCWDVLDILPSHSIGIMLNAIQKCSLFSFGLVATEKLKKYSNHKHLSNIFEAKYLVQLFRYDQAYKILMNVEDSKEKDTINFNILVNLCQEEKAAKIALQTYKTLSNSSSEYDYVILRNSGHLFVPSKAKNILNASVEGFRRIGSQFGYATALNNLGIVEIFENHIDQATNHLNMSQNILLRIGSNEVYQPLVNLSALSLREGNITEAKNHLLAARSSAPRILAMDAVMLDFNEAVLRLSSQELPFSDTLEIFQNLHIASTKTRDIRFIEIVSWFYSVLIEVLTGDKNILYSGATIQKIVKADTVGIEIFTPVFVNGKEIKAPYILSPIWRH